MSIFKFNINNAAVENTPPDKRFTFNINFVWSLLAPLQWTFDLFFRLWHETTITVPQYTTGTYNINDKVIYLGQIYSSNINSNTDRPTSTNWTLIQDDFISVSDRLKITSGKLIQTFALNRQFGTTFRLPTTTTDDTTISDIYIVNNNPIDGNFYVGYNEDECSVVPYKESIDAVEYGDVPLFSEFFVGYTEDESSIVTYYESPDSISYFDMIEIPLSRTFFTVFVPILTYNIYKQRINAFIERYLPIGLTYNLNTY
jgi:hypothetical protein